MPTLSDILISIRLQNATSSGLNKLQTDITAVEQRVVTLRQAAQGLSVASIGLTAAGAAIAAPIYKATEAYNEYAGAVAHLSTAMYDGANNAKNLAESERLAMEISEHHAVSAKSVIDAVYMARSAGMDQAKAMQTVTDATNLVIATTDNAAEAARELEPETRLLTESMKQFNLTSTDTANILTKLQTAGGFRSISEVHYMFEHLGLAAQTFGVNVKEAAAMANTFSIHGLRGEMGGTAAAALISRFGESAGTKLWGFTVHDAKGNLEYAASMERLKASFGNLPKPQLFLELKQLGITGNEAQGVYIFMHNMKEFYGTTAGFGAGALSGLAAAKAAARESAPDEQMVIQAQRIHDMWIQIGSVVSPLVLRWTKELGDLADRMSLWAKANPELAKHAAVIASIVAVTFILLGTLGLIAASILAIISVVASAAAPFILLGALIAWLAGDIYYNWNNLTLANFAKWGIEVLDFIAYPFTHLPAAIKAAWDGIKDATAWIAGKIGRFFIGHSPIPEGPLHDMDLGRDIARTMTGSRIRGAAAALAMSASLMGPMTVPAGAFGGGSGGSVTINYAPRVVINGAGPESEARFRALLEAHAKELVNITKREVVRRGRLEFK